MRKLNNHIKAVSPVIATVLMILVTMAGMTLLFGFVSSYSDTYKAGIGSSVMESIIIEDVSFNSTSITHAYTNQTKIWVYNVGKIDAKITSIYLYGLALTNGSSTFNFDIPVKVGEHVSITVQQPPVWVSGATYDFIINTLRGSKFEAKFTAP
jgi:flagellin-like protein